MRGKTKMSPRLSDPANFFQHLKAILVRDVINAIMAEQDEIERPLTEHLHISGVTNSEGNISRIPGKALAALRNHALRVISPDVLTDQLRKMNGGAAAT